MSNLTDEDRAESIQSAIDQMNNHIQILQQKNRKMLMINESNTKLSASAINGNAGCLSRGLIDSKSVELLTFPSHPTPTTPTISEISVVKEFQPEVLKSVPMFTKPTSKQVSRDVREKAHALSAKDVKYVVGSRPSSPRKPALIQPDSKSKLPFKTNNKHRVIHKPSLIRRPSTPTRVRTKQQSISFGKFDNSPLPLAERDPSPPSIMDESQSSLLVDSKQPSLLKDSIKSKDDPPSLVKDLTKSNHDPPSLIKDSTNLEHDQPSLEKDSTKPKHDPPSLIKDSTNIEHDQPSLVKDSTKSKHNPPTFVKDSTKPPSVKDPNQSMHYSPPSSLIDSKKSKHESPLSLVIESNSLKPASPPLLVCNPTPPVTHSKKAKHDSAPSSIMNSKHKALPWTMINIERNSPPANNANCGSLSLNVAKKQPGTKEIYNKLNKYPRNQPQTPQQPPTNYNARPISALGITLLKDSGNDRLPIPFPTFSKDVTMKVKNNLPFSNFKPNSEESWQFEKVSILGKPQKTNHRDTRAKAKTLTTKITAHDKSPEKLPSPLNCDLSPTLLVINDSENKSTSLGNFQVPRNVANTTRHKSPTLVSDKEITTPVQKPYEVSPTLLSATKRKSPTLSRVPLKLMKPPKMKLPPQKPCVASNISKNLPTQKQPFAVLKSLVATKQTAHRVEHNGPVPLISENRQPATLENMKVKPPTPGLQLPLKLRSPPSKDKPPTFVKWVRL